MFALLAMVFACLIFAEPALAGPGGKIARAAFETFWGRVILVILVFLVILFMPAHIALFDWLKIQERAKYCFYRVHSGWRNEDLSGASSWMPDWHWQNQQQVYSEEWKDQGLVNICKVK